MLVLVRLCLCLFACACALTLVFTLGNPHLAFRNYEIVAKMQRNKNATLQKCNSSINKNIMKITYFEKIVIKQIIYKWLLILKFQEKE